METGSLGGRSPGTSPPTSDRGDVSVSEPAAEIRFTRGPDESTVTVELERLENATHVRVHAPAAYPEGDRSFPVVLRDPGDAVEVERLEDDDLITVTAVGDRLERVVARYQE